VNEPYVQAQKDIGAARATPPGMMAPVAVEIPDGKGGTTPAMLQPPNRPGMPTARVTSDGVPVLPPPKATGADKKEADKLKAVTKYSDTLQKHSIPDFEDALSSLEGLMAKYPVGQAPGLGKGVGLLPDWMQGQDAEEIRQALSGVSNVILKARSGAAVTSQELKRFVNELGSGGFRSEATLRKGIENVRNKFEKIKANAAAGVTDEVKSEYEANGGTPIMRGGAKPALSIHDQADAILRGGK
jgi:hypothetical protein